MLGLEVVKKVAEGSVVDAYLAESSHGRVVVQVSRPELMRDPELYGRFVNQTTLSATRRKHPMLLAPEVTHRGDDGRCVLVTGPVSGRTGADYLAEHGPLSSTQAARIGLMVCEALSYLHRHQVVHGHLSPQNLYFEGTVQNPEVRLLDTGLLLFRSARSLRTQFERVLVPPEYLSPERVRGARGDKSSDVYGMGVLLFELLTGAPPFKGANASQTRELHHLAQLPDLPPHLEVWRPVLQKCLAKSRGDRYPSVDALRSAIASLKLTTELAHDAPTQQEPALVEAKEQLDAGDVLGNYVIVGPLGEGGMGHVYLARHRTLGREVALKVLRMDLAKQAEHLKRFTQEAQAVNRVKHPGIVEVFDYVHEPQGRVYFVMELLKGESLRTNNKTTPMELKRAVRLFRGVAEALATVHAVGIVHRDLKPDNLFVTRDASGAEILKVLDFGIARVRDVDGAFTPRTTMVGQVVGSPMWMAPEQICGQDVDARSDVYSLGTVMYASLAKRFPFEGAAQRELIIERLRSDARPIGRSTFLGEPIPTSLQDLLADCLEREVEKRTATMAEVAQRLREIEQELDGVRAAAPTRRLKPARKRSLKRAVLLALIAAALGAGWMLSHETTWLNRVPVAGH